MAAAITWVSEDLVCGLLVGLMPWPLLRPGVKVSQPRALLSNLHGSVVDVSGVAGNGAGDIWSLSDVEEGPLPDYPP